MSCEKQFVFYAVILSFKLEAGGPDEQKIETWILTVV